MQDFADWIGRERRAEDVITERLLAEFRVTLTGTCGPGAVPPGFHWCLAPELVGPADMGRDSHPRPGLFLPDLGLPRRMWAGGKIEFHSPFQAGETVTRLSRIADVIYKEGRSGRLGFVTVNHRYMVGDRLRLRERQDIVYRAAGGAAGVPEPGEAWQTRAEWQITPDPTLLFRYSALTFNGHRIHYDHPYATEVEGYDGLVVHGPLQAVWMQNLAVEIFGGLPKAFSYRGLSPLTAGQTVTVEARDCAHGLELRVRRVADGGVTMQAKATRV